jgi:hypothetical protein
MEELFERWKTERQPKPNSENEYRRAKDLFVKTKRGQAHRGVHSGSCPGL